MTDLERSCILPRRGGRAQTLHVAAVHALGFVSLAAVGTEFAYGQVKSWEVVLLLCMFFLTMIGITVGFHRLTAHRAFKANRAAKATLIVLGSMAWQGPLLYWVALHRRHHLFADEEGDPHSPHWIDGRKATSRLEGLWHAQVRWPFTHNLTNTAVLCRDLFHDQLAINLSRRYYLWLGLGFVIPAAVGGAIELSLFGALKGALWGGALRVFISYHFINTVNSVTHLFGTRDFETRECSRNNAWFALPTAGEAWHNNHHACPSSAYFGLNAWQFDLGGVVIRALERCGLATDVTRPLPAVLERVRINGKNAMNEGGLR